MAATDGNRTQQPTEYDENDNLERMRPVGVEGDNNNNTAITGGEDDASFVVVVMFCVIIVLNH